MTFRILALQFRASALTALQLRVTNIKSKREIIKIIAPLMVWREYLYETFDLLGSGPIKFLAHA
jgi:hypothetical protein